MGSEVLFLKKYKVNEKGIKKHMDMATIIGSIIGGIAVIIAAIIGVIGAKKRHNKIQLQNNTTSNDTNCENKTEQNDNESLKQKLHILFVDDEKFKVMDNLKRAGWKHVSYKKDITNIDDDAILDAHIIFVDINGVGQNLFPQNQGIGLAAAIKRKYPKKQICTYSAEKQMLDPDLKVVDDTLPKNADPYQFSSFIEENGPKCF